MIDIYEQVRKCEKCKELMHCKETKMSPAIMFNHDNAVIMFIAIQPGKPMPGEDSLSYADCVFQSKLGKLFYQTFMKLSGYSWYDLYASNLIKCPHKNNAQPEECWANNCFEILQQQIDKLPKLKYIILMGKFVENYVKLRPLKTTAKIIAIKHPSYYWRQGDTTKFVEELARIICQT